MANNLAGDAIAQTAIALAKKKTELTALEILDIVCEPYRGVDADFDGGMHDPDFLKIVYDAFFESAPPTPMHSNFSSKVYGEGIYQEWWYDNIYRPFMARYHF